jgi:hypothetical protein
MALPDGKEFKKVERALASGAARVTCRTARNASLHCKRRTEGGIPSRDFVPIPGERWQRMKILTKEDARELLSGKTLDACTAQLSSQLRLVEDAYSTPVSSGVQIVLSKLFAYLMLRDSPVCLYVTGWGVATEHLDLFYGYRRSFGDLRLLMEAPVHIFDPTENEAFVSILSRAFFFSWDIWVFDLAGRWVLRTSHEGWFEVRARDEEAIKDVAIELENYKIPLLAR